MSADLAVFFTVFALRLFVPLLILRYPLPAIFAALVLDAADQTIFQAWTDLNLDSYQSYDKALDVYYLAVAYVATMRNWRNPVAVTVAFGLWYYRLVGVTLFELTEWRPLLLIFPNTFEYFFIAIAAVAVGWNTRRLTARQVMLTAGAIWVFIKLPQEWWIHVAQLDFTDAMKETVLGVDGTDSWSTAFANRPAVTALLIALVIVVSIGAAVVWRRLPERDHPISVDADRYPGDHPAPRPPDERRWTDGLVEKIVLLGLLCVIFANAIPNSQASVVQVLLGAAVVVTANAAIHTAITSRRGDWASVGAAFGAGLVINTGIAIGLAVLLPSDDDGSSRIAVGFFLFTITLIVAIFDRYRDRRPPFTLRDPVEVVELRNHAAMTGGYGSTT